VTSGRKKPIVINFEPGPEVDGEAEDRAYVDDLINKGEAFLAEGMPTQYYTDVAREIRDFMHPERTHRARELERLYERLRAEADAGPSVDILRLLHDSAPMEDAPSKKKKKGGMWEEGVEALGKRKRHVVSKTF
jgi:hypothetical protein